MPAKAPEIKGKYPMNKTTLDQIKAHYCHACQKHPYFADRFSRFNFNDWRAGCAVARHQLKNEIAEGAVGMDTVLLCEVSEVFTALQDGDQAAAAAECYDAIAVLLRIVDVLEVRAKLGKPETEGEAK